MADDIDRLDENCGGCGQRHQCREVYAHLGRAAGPSTVSRVVVAFLGPMVIFIVALALAENLFACVTSSRTLQTAAGLAAAVLTSCCWVSIFRTRPHKTGRHSTSV